jgi:hypothetical protein
MSGALIPWIEPQTDPDGYFGGVEDAGNWRRLAPRYTALESSLAAQGGIRLGVNPGEPLDFFAGRFGFDVYDEELLDESDDGTEPAASVEAPRALARVSSGRA